jgi:transposase
MKVARLQGRRMHATNVIVSPALSAAMTVLALAAALDDLSLVAGSDGVDAPQTASMFQGGAVGHKQGGVRERGQHDRFGFGEDHLSSICRGSKRRCGLSKAVAAEQCFVVLCASAPVYGCDGGMCCSHYWSREILRLGHDVRLIPPSYVKPFVKRQKNDAADAEAICEASQRPTMRFVQVKSEASQAAAIVFRARDLLVRQRTQVINALRGHLAEFGFVVAQGATHVERLIAQAQDQVQSLPEAARPVIAILVETLHSLDNKIAVLDAEIACCAEEDDDARRLKTIPGIGPVTATAITALAPAPQTFARGRDFAAWLGLTPLQRSTGGKQKLGETSKRGERTPRRLLIIGASAVVRWAAAKALQ